MAAIKTRQLTKGEDFDFKHLGRGAFITADRLTGIGWLSERAVQAVQDLFVEVRVLDRAGDAHERDAADEERRPTAPAPRPSLSGLSGRLVVDRGVCDAADARADGAA